MSTHSSNRVLQAIEVAARMDAGESNVMKITCIVRDVLRQKMDLYDANRLASALTIHLNEGPLDSDVLQRIGVAIATIICKRRDFMINNGFDTDDVVQSVGRMRVNG